MFLELNELKTVVAHVPPGVRPFASHAWDALLARVPCVFLVDGEQRAPWEQWARGRNGLAVPWATDYLIPPQGNLRHALETVDRPPYETVSMCCAPEELGEAVPTRVATLPVGTATAGVLPDCAVNNVSEAGELLTAEASGRATGYIGALSGTVGAPRRQTTGQLIDISRLMDRAPRR
jgi:hypothetical protein